MKPDRHEREIDTLVQLSAVVNSSLDIIEVLDNSMRFVEELIGAEASSIFEVDNANDEIFFRLARGEGGTKAEEIRMKMGDGIAGWVARDGKPVIVPDVSRDDRFSHKVDEHTGFITRSMICLPIKNKGRIIGILQVLNKKGPRPFDEEDMEVLSIVANQVGIAIENARLYARLKAKFALTEDELKKTEAKLIRTERMAALGKMAQGVAHEVRNPVMSIGGFARRMKKQMKPDDPAMNYVDIIIKETDRLEKTVKDVEEYTGMPEPVIKETSFSELLNGVIQTWRKDYVQDNIKIETDLIHEDPKLYVDKRLMTRALTNLMRNAKDAMPDGGTISIKARWEGSRIVISIKDTGPGIAPADLPRIFDPFFTSRPQGSGLGLTTVNRIIGDHGGEVKVSSTLGKGAEFKIFLEPFPENEF